MHNRQTEPYGLVWDACLLIKDKKVQWISSAGSARIGYSDEELIGREVTTLLPPDKMGEFSRAYEDLLESRRKSVRLRTTLMATDGEAIPVEFSMWRTEFNGRVSVALIIMELDESEGTQKALRESDEKFRVMLESIAEGIAVIDLDSRILDMNGVMLRLYGYDRKEEVTGRSAFEFIPEEYRDIALEHQERNLQEGRNDSLEIALVNKDGVRYEAEISAAPLRDKAGQPVGFIAVTKDITERKLAQREIQHRLLFEELIANISTRFINYPLEEIDRGIENALREVTEFNDVDRGYVCLISDDEGIIEKTYEWCAEGVESSMVTMQGMSRETAPWWVGKLKQLENIQVSPVSQLPEEAYNGGAAPMLDGVRSSLTVPMHHGESLVGFLSFHSIHTEKRWSEEDIALLKIVGETFINALARKKVEEALRRAEELNRTLVDTASKAGEGLAVFQDKEGDGPVCVFANDEFARIAGYSPGELMGKAVPDNIPTVILESPHDGETIDRGGLDSHPRFEIEFTGEEGRTIPVDVGVVTTNYLGQPATVVYLRDITDLKRQQEENQELQETLKLYSNQVIKASKELVYAIRGVNTAGPAKSGSGTRRVPGGGGRIPYRRDSDDVELLTGREVQVLQLAGRGLSNKEIAEDMGITVRTVKGHLINIFAKMKVKSRTEAVSCALREGWITMEDIGYIRD
ncbi:MAG: PAS domain S-box protein [Dehalococcoidia bacterium]